MREWLKDSGQKLILGLTLLVVVSLVAGLAGGCAESIIDDLIDVPTPEFEGTVLTDADVNQIMEDARLIEEAGGLQNSTIFLMHDFQEEVMVLVEVLDTLSNEGESLSVLFFTEATSIPLILDALYACARYAQEALTQLGSKDSLIIASALDEVNDVCGSNLQKLKDAFRYWVVEVNSGSSGTSAEDVFVGVSPEEVEEAAKLLGITPDDLKERLKQTSPGERLTEEVLKEAKKLIVKPTGKSFPAIAKSWFKGIGKALTQGGKKIATRAALAGKLANLVVDYGEAIIHCYWNNFPELAKIELCLVEERGLDPNVAKRIAKAVWDP